MWIKIETKIDAPLGDVWSAWTTPEAITQWNFATDGWACPRASCDLLVGGKFSYRMEAKDGSMGFDFEGEFTQVQEHEQIEFKLGDGRKVRVTFTGSSDETTISEEFEAEHEASAEQQKQGWQSILNNFKAYVENL